MKTKLFPQIIFLSILTIPLFSQTTLTLRPDSISGKDALILSCVECGYNTRNFGNHPDFDAIAWTNNGNESIARGLLEFNLNSIPANSIVINAQLSLFYNPTSTNIGHSWADGPNTCLLKRIIQSWDENTVTWDSQPNTTDSNKVILHQSTTFYQNYPFIDVTKLINDMIKSPGQNHGFMLQLYKELYYRSMIFASSDHPDTTLHPLLKIVYKTSTGFQDFETPYNVNLFPNPCEGRFTIKSDVLPLSSIEIKNIIGVPIYRKNGLDKQTEINLIDIPAGIYLVNIKTEKSILTKKVIVN